MAKTGFAMDSAQPLNYAPRELQPRRWYRIPLRITAGLAVVFAAIFWGPGLCRWGSVLYWERRALKDGPAPNSLVVDWLVGQRTNNNTPNTSAVEAHLLNLFAGGGSVANFPNFFVGKMLSANGDRRLVILDFDPQAQIGAWWSVRATTIRDSADPRDMQPQDFVIAGNLLPLGSQRLRIFGAQPDSGNPTHLTFDFEIDGNRCTADVWLKNNGTLMIVQRP
jgi:hypothetical protein